MYNAYPLSQHFISVIEELISSFRDYILMNQALFIELCLQ